MRKLLYWFTGLLPCRIISDNNTPYLERYYLCSLLGIRFYVHRFVGSDPVRGLHDHPWVWAASLILSGWYYEENRYGIRRVRWVNWLTGNTFHRVILPTDTNEKIPGHKYPSEVWTLFFHQANYAKPWGFLSPTELPSSFNWTPYDYSKKGTGIPKSWWLRAPIGKNEPGRKARA